VQAGVHAAQLASRAKWLQLQLHAEEERGLALRAELNAQLQAAQAECKVKAREALQAKAQIGSASNALAVQKEEAERLRGELAQLRHGLEQQKMAAQQQRAADTAAYTQVQGALQSEVHRAQAQAARAEAGIFAAREALVERDAELHDLRAKLQRMQSVLDKVL